MWAALDIVLCSFNVYNCEYITPLTSDFYILYRREKKRKRADQVMMMMSMTRAVQMMNIHGLKRSRNSTGLLFV